MADNGNRGPNDFRARNGKRRREPPIIDASATEVPLDPVTPADAVPSEPASAGPADDPVLFGGARRTSEPEPAGAGEPEIVPSALDGEPAPGERAPSPLDPADAEAKPAEPVELVVPVEPTSAAEPKPAEPIEPATPEAAASAPVPPLAGTGEPSRASAFAAEPRSSSPVVAPARSGGGGAAWLLGLSNLALLAALGWVLYTAPQRDGRAEIADLRSKVAALEARPDAAQVQNGVAGLDKTVAGLSAKLDAVAQQAQGAKADADRAAAAAGAAQSDANKAPATGAAAVATVGALAALAARVDGVDKGVSALSAEQAKTAKAVADLPKPVPPDFGPTDAKIAGVESRLSGKVAALDGRLTALDGKVNGSDARLNAFDAKVNGVDGKINGFDARMNGLDARINGVESKLTETATGLGRLQATVANLPRVDLSPLQAATAALGAEVAKIEGQLSAPKDGTRVTEARAVGSADETRATPIALVGQAVGRAIADGRPYSIDLDALRALGAEPEAVAKLQPLAAKGAPTAAALKAQWDAVSPDVLAATAPAQTGSALDRLGASALSLVQVRQVGAVKGDDAGAVATQIDAALDAGDVAGALAAWGRLPQAGQDRSKDWAAAARARVEAAQAAQGLVARAIATLGKTKS
ncbi:hypothetical protein [Lichenibacterium dinghuense]|uniref:hypothetical protein n=1 Tax=Lichenibacterium dinghuense TaxID=2895977 RepID=UPI001F21DAEC|nr:hypothetical protein [Lichenibacterium sp. 6Y81]